MDVLIPKMDQNGNFMPDLTHTRGKRKANILKSYNHVILQIWLAKDEEEERELSQRDGARKKLGKWERRQRRIAAAGKAAEGVDAPAKEEDDFLQPVANPQELPPANPLPSGNKKLKLRKDGSALQVPCLFWSTSDYADFFQVFPGFSHVLTFKSPLVLRENIGQASGQHVFFSKDGSKKTSELAQLESQDTS